MIRTTLFSMTLLMLTGCTAQVGPAIADARSAINIKGIPSEAPYIVGVITSLEVERILVEEHAGQVAGSAKASLRLVPSTRIVDRSGKAVRPSNLRVGQQVQVWVSGPVMESYPTQGTAAVVVIAP